MRKSIARLAIVAVLLGMLGVETAAAYHSGTCGTSNSSPYVRKTLKDPNATIDNVAPKKIDNILLPKGVTDVIVDGAGDVDITVCVIGGADVCESHEAAGVPDECSGLNRNSQYVLFVKHCTNAACGYPADHPVGIDYAVILTYL